MENIQHKTTSVTGILRYYGVITRDILEEVVELQGTTQFIHNSKVYGTTIGEMDRLVYDVEKMIERNTHEMFDDMIDVYYNGQ